MVGDFLAQIGVDSAEFMAWHAICARNSGVSFFGDERANWKRAIMAFAKARDREAAALDRVMKVFTADIQPPSF